MNFFNQFKRSAHSQGGHISACCPSPSWPRPPDWKAITSLQTWASCCYGCSKSWRDRRDSSIVEIILNFISHKSAHEILRVPRVENGAVFSDARIFPIFPFEGCRARQKVRCALSRVENEYKHLKIMLRFFSPEASEVKYRFNLFNRAADGTAGMNPGQTDVGFSWPPLYEKHFALELVDARTKWEVDFSAFKLAVAVAAAVGKIQ